MGRKLELQTDDPVVVALEVRRRELKLKVNKLCRLSGVALYTYYHWLDGSVKPSLMSLRAVMKVLGMELEIRVKSKERRAE